ncbi:BolA family transcriptional regulator [Methylovorus menthalis]|uniref:BolA family protein n=1 Tax=Methylovorus menthalis TaxID=1002227 RepID=UPI001E5F9458|nr:BolA family protein [Methylovorus menthalis]MCB4812206.1 BolA family transcriptional regulator [Methylovorus menthalis]
MTLLEEIRSRLAVLEPVDLVIQDDSALHAGHAGNGGGGHFNVRIVSSQFSGKSPIIRHRIVYQALADLIPTRIHALSIRAVAPDETNP